METINPLRRAMAAQKTRNNINSNIVYYTDLFEKAKQSVINNPANPMLQQHYHEKMLNYNTKLRDLMGKKRINGGKKGSTRRKKRGLNKK